jgi:hypothetical protein
VWLFRRRRWTVLDAHCVAVQNDLVYVLDSVRVQVFRPDKK